MDTNNFQSERQIQTVHSYENYTEVLASLVIFCFYSDPLSNEALITLKSPKLLMIRMSHFVSLMVKIRNIIVREFTVF